MEVLATSIPLTVNYKSTNYASIFHALARHEEEPTNQSIAMLSDLIAIILMQFVVRGSESSVVAEHFPELTKVKSIDILDIEMRGFLPMEFTYRVNGGDALSATSYDLYQCSADLEQNLRPTSHPISRLIKPVVDYR